MDASAGAKEPSSTPAAPPGGLLSWRYVEPCCGSASIALALLGARRPLLPYQGSKWRFRKSILDTFAKLGFTRAPHRVDVCDVGPWGVVAPCVIRPRSRAGIIDQLELLARLDPRLVYDALHQHAIPDDEVTYSAQFLFLQRLAYSGKAVGDRGKTWSSPGFNSSSAYGLPGTERFGKVNPMIPSLLGVLGSYASLTCPEHLGGGRTPATAPTEAVREPTLVYIDPPYQGSTGYPAGDLDRLGVCDLARAWQAVGARVVVSEAEAVDALVAEGWTAQPLDGGRKDTSRFRGKQEEWLTISPEA